MEAVKTYYIVEVDDTSPGGYTKSTWIVYVNDQGTLENLITRAQGLAGHNCRKYGHVWTKGQLTSYHLKIYASKAALETAEAGGSDVYIADYLVTIRYDSNYNPYEITSVKQ